MKKYLLLTILFLGVTSLLKSQSFGTIGSEWYYKYNTGGALNSDYGYIHYQSIKDTIIFGNECHVISSKSVQYKPGAGTPDRIDTINHPDRYIYQDADTVFALNGVKNKFLKLYTFNVKIGDTIAVETLQGNKAIIDSVKSENINGVILKRYFATTQGGFSFSYLDRVGYFEGFYPNIGPGFIPEYDETLKCFKDQNLSLHFSDIPCDQIITGIESRNPQYTFKVFLNQTNGSINITNIKDYKETEVYDVKGAKITTSQDQSIDIESYPSGIYFLLIHTKHTSYPVRIAKYL